MHLHNSDVLSFLQLHKSNPKIKAFMKHRQEEINQTNQELDEDYKDYFDYLERNIGDDASYTIEELKALLR